MGGLGLLPHGGTPAHLAGAGTLTRGVHPLDHRVDLFDADLALAKPAPSLGAGGQQLLYRVPLVEPGPDGDGGQSAATPARLLFTGHGDAHAAVGLGNLVTGDAHGLSHMELRIDLRKHLVVNVVLLEDFPEV